VVIGLGNVLRGDDGIGPRAIAALARERLPDDVELIDGGNAGLTLLDWLEGRDTAIIIDAASMNRVPGTVVRFDCDDAIDNSQADIGVTHAPNAFAVLLLAEQLGTFELPRITIFGIEPESVEPSMSLTRTGEAALSEVVRRVRLELQVADISAVGVTGRP
jgi:hydrogenase maturation protease